MNPDPQADEHISAAPASDGPERVPATATDAPGDAPGERPPVRAGVWCMGCFYDLRGLTSTRCPECGRWFDPENTATYSRTPTPERLKKLVKQTALTLSDTLHLLAPPPPPEDVRRRSLAAKVGELWQENATLRLQFELLIGHLVDKGLLQRDEIDALLSDVKGAAANAALSIIDDTPDEDEPVPSQDLLDLRRAASPDAEPE